MNGLIFVSYKTHRNPIMTLAELLGNKDNAVWVFLSLEDLKLIDIATLQNIFAKKSIGQLTLNVAQFDRHNPHHREAAVLLVNLLCGLNCPSVALTLQGERFCCKPDEMKHCLPEAFAGFQKWLDGCPIESDLISLLIRPKSFTACFNSTLQPDIGRNIKDNTRSIGPDTTASLLKFKKI